MGALVTTEAPDFVAPAVMPNGVIEDNFKLSDYRGSRLAKGRQRHETDG
jgi:peroxiredoxin (alkyl hydroperoxide reductase subunit C)